MAREERAIFTNMCMVTDGNGNVLVQDRLNPNWPGIAFPGGHVEAEESFTAAVIREVREETGLTIENPVLCGTKQFQALDGARYVVFFYKANQFQGILRSSEEGKVFWLPRCELPNQKLAPEMMDIVQIMESDNLNELFYQRVSGVLQHVLY